MAAAAGAGRGPLGMLMQSSVGQYSLLGAGGYYLAFPEKVQQMMAPYIMKLPSSTGSTSTASAVPQIITIHTPGSNGNNNNGNQMLNTTVGLVVYAVGGAGLCWIGYFVCTNWLPDSVAQMMPVTKAVFSKATETLGRGILNIKKVLEEKILGVSKKQDELSKKQDLTNEEMGRLNNSMQEARGDLRSVKSSLERCEDSLDQSQAMQGYSLKGIKLLVRCVTTFLPDDGGYINDIARFMREGESPELNDGSGSHEPPIARAHALSAPPIATVNSITRIPEDELSPYYHHDMKSSHGNSSSNHPHHRSSTSDANFYSTPPAQPSFQQQRTLSAPLLYSNNSSCEHQPVPRPSRTKAVLYGQDTREIVDIQALLGH